MKKVLWVSRHEMTPSQVSDLARVMEDEVELLTYRDTVKDVEALSPLIEQVSALAVVLPTEMLAKLLPLTGGKPVLQAVSARQPTGNTTVLPSGRTEQEFAFVHEYWQQVLRVEIETRRL